MVREQALRGMNMSGKMPIKALASSISVIYNVIEAKERFDEEGISIPFPQRDVHLIPQGGGGLGDAVSQPAPKAT